MLENIVLTLVGMVCGNITMFLLLPQKRKSENLKNETLGIENQAKQSDEWYKLYEEERNENKELNKKIDSLYEELAKERDMKNQLYIQNTELQVENTRLTILKCEVPSCINRNPLTGY